MGTAKQVSRTFVVHTTLIVEFDDGGAIAALITAHR